MFGGIASKEKVFITGHPFNSEEVKERMPKAGDGRSRAKIQRRDHIIFSSRWDDEKNPLFFLDVARVVVQNRPNAKFIICTSSEKLKSNNPINLTRLQWAIKQFPNNIILKEGLTKEDYYKELCIAKIQMNTADQDFVAITLLESSVAGCYPIYPYFRSFPETFRYKPEYMYGRLNLKDAVQKVMAVLDKNDLWTQARQESRAWIYKRFDSSWLRMLKVMDNKPISDPYEF